MNIKRIQKESFMVAGNEPSWVFGDDHVFSIKFMPNKMFTIDELRQWPGSCGGCSRRVGCGWSTGCNKMLKLNSTTLSSSLGGQMESKRIRDGWSHWKLYVHSPNVTFTNVLSLRASWGTMTDDFRLMSFSVHWDSLYSHPWFDQSLSLPSYPVSG